MATPKPLPFNAAAATLNDFIAGANSELIAALRALTDGSSSIRSVYIWGEAGSGKSTLLRAVCNHVQRRRQSTYLISAGADTLPPFGDGLLAVDDVGRLPPAAQITLFDWHNRADSTPTLALLASADCPPPQLNLYGELASRLTAGLVFQLQPLTDSEKSRALTVLAQRHGFTLPSEIAALLLTRLPRNMHTLSAALLELDSFFLTQKKPFTLRRVHSWLVARTPESPLFEPPPDSGTA